MSDFNREEWLKSLKPGDKVASRVVLGYVWSDSNSVYNDTYEILEVKKITPKGYIRLSNNILLSENGTYHKYDTWYHSTSYNIEPITKEILDKVSLFKEFREQGRILLKNIDKINKLWSQSDLSLGELKRVNEFLSNFIKEIQQDVE